MISDLRLRFWSKSVKEREHSEDLVVDGRIPLMRFLSKCVWIVFVWLKIAVDAKLLCTRCSIKRCAFIGYLRNYWSRLSSGSIVPDYGLGDRGSIPGRGKGFFSLTSVSRPALGPTQPPVQWGGPLPVGKARPGRNADHSPPSSAEVVNE
jgi:hypothetical protein